MVCNTRVIAIINVDAPLQANTTKCDAFNLTCAWESGACQVKACPSADELRCQVTGRCVRFQQACDGKNDCGPDDSTDELNCGPAQEVVFIKPTTSAPALTSAPRGRRPGATAATDTEGGKGDNTTTLIIAAVAFVVIAGGICCAGAALAMAANDDGIPLGDVDTEDGGNTNWTTSGAADGHPAATADPTNSAPLGNAIALPPTERANPGTRLAAHTL